MRNLVLVIEDDKVMRSILLKLLKSKGFNVMTAEDGYLGFQLAKENQPDLIICDLNLPNLNGYGVLKKIREDGVLAKTPLIFVSSENDGAIRRRACQLGANDYLVKPLDSDKLFDSIFNQLKHLNHDKNPCY